MFVDRFKGFSQNFNKLRLMHYDRNFTGGISNAFSQMNILKFWLNSVAYGSMANSSELVQVKATSRYL